METNQSTEPSKLSNAIVLLIFGALTIVCIWYGINGLFLSDKQPMEKIFNHAALGTMYEGEIPYVSNTAISQSVIVRYRWAGTEYYYVVLSEDKKSAVIVRTTKHWGDNLGNEQYNKVNKQASGIVKELRYKSKQRLSSTFDSLEASGIQVDRQMYLDLLAKPVCWAALFEGLGIVLCVIYVLCLLKKARDFASKPTPMAVHIFMLIIFILMIVAFIFMRNKLW